MVNSYFTSGSPTLFFGLGTIRLLANQVKLFGYKVLLITGTKSFPDSIKSLILKDFDKYFFSAYFETVSHEPNPELIDRISAKYKDKKIDIVIGIGGGSVIDAGKAISAMLTVSGSVINYLEDIGTKIHPGTKIPFIAIPTTAGTGSEVTKNAVVSNIDSLGFKKSLRHENFIPSIAIVDPTLTLTCPKDVSAASGMDAFTQLLESFISTKSTPFTDNLAITGLIKIEKSLTEVVNNEKNIGARSDISYAAMLSGFTLANAGLGVIHGFASSIGGLFNIPHGVVCGTLMAISNKITIEKLLKYDDKNIALKKYLQVAHLFIKKNNLPDKEKLNKFIDKLFELIEKLNIPRLSNYGIKKDDFNKIIKLTSNKNNPFLLDSEDLFQILEARC